MGEGGERAGGALLLPLSLTLSPLGRGDWIVQVTACVDSISALAGLFSARHWPARMRRAGVCSGAVGLAQQLPAGADELADGLYQQPVAIQGQLAGLVTFRIALVEGMAGV